MKAYWDILRELREDHDLTQAQVAAVIGTTQQVYYRYEKGINELPLHHLQTLCAYYNASADYILGRRDCAGRAEGLFFYAATAGC